MSSLFDPIINLLRETWQFFWPIVIPEPWEKGVVLRFGKYHRLTEEGWVWHLPFKLEKVWLVDTVPQTIRLNKQSITTEDGKNVVVSAIVKYQIKDVKAYILDILNGREVISEVSLGAVRRVITPKNWEAVRHEDIEDELRKEVAKEVRKFGVEVLKVTLSDLAVIKSIRLLLDHEKEYHTLVD